MKLPQQYPKRLIEVDLPIKRISEHARREKSIRHGHISTLHIWWARRPLAACRAVVCAALWPDPADPLCPDVFRQSAARTISDFAGKVIHNTKLATEHCSPESFKRWNFISTHPFNIKDKSQLNDLRQALLDFIADFSNWDNSTVKEYLDAARALTQSAHEALGGASGTKPLVVDPFAGGGSIPLEALRIGADAFASDINPVPVLLNKVVLEYIPKYGQQLADEVSKWGKWLKCAAEKDLAEFYPKDSDGAIPIAYLWARTIRCEGPDCGAEIPLYHSSCLAQKGKNSTNLKLKIDRNNKRIEFEIVNGKNSNEQSAGVLKRSSATCPLCGYTTPAANVRNQFKGRQGGTQDARLLAVVTTKENESGRSYRLPRPQDERVIKRAVDELHRIRKNMPEEVPDEPLPYLRSIFNIHLLDVTKWSQLFSTRQLVSLITLGRLVRKAEQEIKTNDSKLREAIVTCLALAVDRVAAQYSSLSWWQPKGEFVVGTFGRQALGIVWDFAEIKPVKGASGDLDGAINWIIRVIESNSGCFQNEATVVKATAIKHPLPDDSATAVITDPPYYDAVPYADLSDFFYVFLKRMLKGLHPELFGDILTPKNGEIVQLAERNPIYAFKTKEYFEKGMHDALSEARRLTAPGGISIIVFAHKTTQGWEVMLSSIISAGWTVTASWPIDTERAVRMRASDSAALASSIHLVCRPRENADGASRTGDVGDWRDVLEELPRRIHEWMPKLAEEGIVGADAIFACLGPALEIYSRYFRVEKANGEAVTLKEYLEQVWAAVAKEALAMVFHGADAAGFEPDARLTAIWLWTLSTPNGANSLEQMSSESESADDSEADSEKQGQGRGFTLEYDAARKIAQGLGIHLEDLNSVVEIDGEVARLLALSERSHYLLGKDESKEALSGRKRKEKQGTLFPELEELEEKSTATATKSTLRAGATTLDKVHQCMILFAAGRGEALKRLLVEEGIGRDSRFWKLAQALCALYPSGSDEKRWAEGVLARKKSLGL